MTDKPKLLIVRHLPDAVEARVGADYDTRIMKPGEEFTTDELIGAAHGKDAILTCPVDPLNADTIAKLPDSIKIIATFSVGFEHIDVEAATARGIKVTHTPDVLTGATADIAMLLMLGAARRATEGAAEIREGQWGKWQPTHMMGTEVNGKRLGIFGMGRIGQALAKRARAFDMEIHYHNRSRLSPELEQGATYYETPDALLPHCDFLSLHCPLTPQTHHFLNTERIAQMPDGAIVVNTARGPVVDDEALIAALKSGKLQAAGLDVFEGEPNLSPGYLDLPNAFLLPHLGSATVETRNAMGFCALDNLDAFFRGETPPNALN